jgi:hypothetical protein
MNHKILGNILTTGSILGIAGVGYMVCSVLPAWQRTAQEQSFKQHFNQHKNDKVFVIKENKDYLLLDSRPSEFHEYKFAIANDIKDSVKMMKENTIFGKIDKNGLTLSKFEDGSFKIVTTAQNFAIKQ